MIQDLLTQIRTILLDWQLRLENKLDWSGFDKPKISDLIDELIDEACVPENINESVYQDIEELESITHELRVTFESSEIISNKSIDASIDYCISELRKSRSYFEYYFDNTTSILKPETPLSSRIAKKSAGVTINIKLSNEPKIIFKDAETIERIIAEIKNLFENEEKELINVFNNTKPISKLIFKSNQNKFIELLRRATYNGFIISEKTQIRDWVCAYFQFIKNKGEERSVADFNKSTVYDILSKGRGEPNSTDRICNVEWLPYTSHRRLQEKDQKERL